MKKAHREKFDAFWRKRTQIADPTLATHFKHDSTQQQDLAFLSRFIHPDSRVLDLGAGTCFVAGRLAETAKEVVAVDRFREFLAQAPRRSNLVTIEADLLSFNPSGLFDCIIMFGVMNYFDLDEAHLLYQRCAHWLKPGGKLAVKHQCGVDEDVVVNGWSERLGMDYFAFYRSALNEYQLIQRFFAQVEQIDIYPPENNPWPNTHFYAFVATNP